MFCNNCGSKLEDDAVFCANCGARVDDMLPNGNEMEQTPVAENPEEPDKAWESADNAEEITTVESVNTDAAQEVEYVPDEIVSEEPQQSATVIAVQEELPRKIFCPNCGAENDVDDVFCKVCGGALRNSLQPMVNVPEDTSKKRKKIFVIAAAGAAAVAVVCIAVFLLSGLIKGLGSKGNEKDHVLYITDNSLTMAKGRKFTPLEIEDRCFEDKDNNPASYEISAYSNEISYSPDNKYIYYPHDLNYNYPFSYDLYRKRLDKAKTQEEKIDSDVFCYKVIDNDRVAYIKNTGDYDLKLYIYDDGDSSKVASDVSALSSIQGSEYPGMQVSENGKYILWKSDDGLYVQETSLKDDKIKLESHMSYVYGCSKNMDKIVYTKDDNLYIMKNFEDREKIASDVSNVYVYGIDSNLGIYYTKEGDSDAYTSYELINDDMLMADNAIVEPDISDYQTVTYVDTLFGRRERVTTDDSYYEAMDVYNGKLNRDSIREMLKERTTDLQMTEIYYYNDKSGESEKVFDSVVVSQNRLGLDTERALLGVWNVDMDNMEYPKFSELIEKDDYYSSFYDLEDSIMEKKQLSCINNGEVREIPIKDMLDDDYTNVYFSGTDEKAHRTYLTQQVNDGDENHRSLYSYDYSSKNASLELISEEVSCIARIYDGDVYYTNEDGELYCNEDKIATDVSGYSVVVYDGGVILYITDSSKGEGTLNIYKGGKNIKIADDVFIDTSLFNGGVTEFDRETSRMWSYGIFDGGKVAYLVDYNRTKMRGDLEVFDGKNTVLVDSDVSVIIF